MRRLTKAASLVLTAAILGALALSASASAAPVETGSFGCEAGNPCAGAETWQPGRLAVNEETGSVYVIDTEHDALQVFSSTGTYLSQILGSTTTAGSFSFGESAVAIDNNPLSARKGWIYVSSESAAKIFAFNTAGVFQWESPSLSGFVCGVAVDNAGIPWYGGFEIGVQKLSPTDGSPVGSPLPVASDACQLTFDTAGDILVNHYHAGVEKFDAVLGTSLLTYEPAETSFDVATDSGTGAIYAVVTGASGNGIRKWNEAGDLTELISAGALHGVTNDSQRSRLYASTEGEEVLVFTTFEPSLTITKVGQGTGTVTCDGGGACATQNDFGSETTLEAFPGAGSLVGGWKVNGVPACGTAATCAVTLNANTTVEVEFGRIQHNLKVSKSGAGTGKVTSTPAGIDCGATCEALFTENEFIVLSATPAAGSTFGGWLVDGSASVCPGTGPCELELGADAEVTASFATQPSGGGGGGGTSPVVPPAVVSPPTVTVLPPLPPKPLKCKKGFTKKRVKGKAKCVRVKPKSHKKSHH